MIGCINQGLMLRLFKFSIPLFLLLTAGEAFAQHTLDFFIPPCPYVGIIDAGQPSAAIRVFPQPATNELTIEFDDPGLAGVGSVELSMYDIMGRLILRETASPGATKTRLDVTVVSPGIYLLQIRMNHSTQNHRIIVTR